MNAAAFAYLSPAPFALTSDRRIRHFLLPVSAKENMIAFPSLALTGSRSEGEITASVGAKGGTAFANAETLPSRSPG